MVSSLAARGAAVNNRPPPLKPTPPHDPSKRKKVGRPSAKVEERMFRAFCRVVTPEKWAEATEVMLGRALAGEVRAYKILAPYAMGRPLVRIKAETEIILSEPVLSMIDRIYGGGV